MKTKMTFAVAAACLVAASAYGITATAEGYQPTASPTTMSVGDATIEDVTAALAESGTPSGGKISNDDPDISEGYTVDLVQPTVEILDAALDGTTFNGTLSVDATNSSGPLDRVQVQISGSLLLESGETFGIVTYPIQLDNLGIENESTTVALTASLAEFVEQWSVPGLTVNVNGVDTRIASMSPVFQLRVYTSYTDPTHGLTGMQPVGPVSLTLIR